MKKILFTDIDGCFIIDSEPDFEMINAEFERLTRAGIDIILSTAKTAHEVIALNQHLNLPGPFIVENGAGLLIRVLRDNDVGNTQYLNVSSPLQRHNKQRDELTGGDPFRAVNEAAFDLCSDLDPRLLEKRSCEEPLERGRHAQGLRGVQNMNHQQMLDNDGIQLNQYLLLQLGGSKPDLTRLMTFCPPASLLTQMSNNQLLTCCRLSPDAATLAKLRFFTEPIYIKNLSFYQLKKLKKQLRDNGFYFAQTNNFLHACTSKNTHKGAAVQLVISKLYATTSCMTFAIGDSLNDFSMLNGCDFAYYILNVPLKCYGVNWHLITDKYFSGWQTAINHIVSSPLGLLCINQK